MKYFYNKESERLIAYDEEKNKVSELSEIGSVGGGG
jgi:hypothetical protein